MNLYGILIDPGLYTQDYLVEDRVDMAAIRLKDGSVYTGACHLDAYTNAEEAGAADEHTEFDDGFVTDKGKFISRAEAYKLAQDNRQIDRGVTPGRLDSVDLGVDC